MKLQIRAAGVALRDDHVLIHRADLDEFWALPGGRVDRGEPAAEALRREMREELDVEAEVRELLWCVENFFTYRGDAYHEIGFYFRMDLPAELWRPDAWEIEEEGIRFIFRWLPLRELEDLDVRPAFLRTALARPPAALEHRVHRHTEPE